MSAGAASTSFSKQFAKVVVREAIRFKTAVALMFATISLCVLVAGMLSPKNYTSSATVYVSQVANGGSVDKLDQGIALVEAAKKPEQLQKLVVELGLVEQPSNDLASSRAMITLAQQLDVTYLGSGFVKLSYTGSDPAEVYNVVSKYSEILAADSRASIEARKLEEEERALRQKIEQHQSQLAQVEERLKQFHYDRGGPTLPDIKERISDIRFKMDAVRLDIEGTKIRLKSLEKELALKSKTAARVTVVDELSARLSSAQKQLDQLLLTYTPDYPDVVALQQEITNLKQSIARQQLEHSEVDKSATLDELRRLITNEEIELNSKQRQLSVLNTELQRAENALQGHARRCEALAELELDYEAKNAAYQGLLKRLESFERPRPSDKQSSSVSFRVQEPANFPKTPDGLRFMHFAVAGPLLGLFLPFGLLIAYVKFDPKIRFSASLNTISRLPVLGVVPHVPTPLAERMTRSDVVFLGVFIIIVVGIYITVAFAHEAGVIG